MSCRADSTGPCCPLTTDLQVALLFFNTGLHGEVERCQALRGLVAALQDDNQAAQPVGGPALAVRLVTSGELERVVRGHERRDQVQCAAGAYLRLDVLVGRQDANGQTGVVLHGRAAAERQAK